MINKSILLLVLNFIVFQARAQDSLRFLALGDSYTIGQSVDARARWPVQLRDSLVGRGYAISQPLIIARTGWRTDELKQAIEQRKPGKHYDLVGLLIGVNNQYQGRSPASYEPEFEELLQMAIEHADGNEGNVFVISIPDYGYTPFGAARQQEISAALDTYNDINRRLAKYAGVKYYYITDISRNKDSTLVARDGLHPSGQQYALWVAHLLKNPAFFKMLD